MVKNIAIACFAVVLLSGCSSTKRGHVSDAEMQEFASKAGDRVFFTLDSAKVSHESQATLEKQATWLKAHDKYSVTVEGHCDSRGTREYNIALGEKRAHSAKKVLENHGIASDKIETISYGKERPAELGETEAAWAKNRRAVTAIK